MNAPLVDRRSSLILAALLALAAALRWATLARESLWFDEVLSWHCSSGTLTQALHCEVNKPPIYYPLLYFWMRLFGHSEAAMRSLSIPPGLLSVWLIYRLGTALFSRPIGSLAAGYLAVSSFHIFYAQEARNYTWLVLFLLLASLSLWKGITSESSQHRMKHYAAYTLFATLALFTHFFAAFFLAAHGLFVLFFRPRQVLYATVSIGAAIALIAPWILVMLRDPMGTLHPVRRYLLLKLPQAYFSFMFGDSLIPLDEQAVLHVTQVLRDNWWILAASLCSAAILAPFVWLAWKRWGEAMLYALTLSTVPVLIAFLISFKMMVFDERYMIPASPFLYLAIAAAVWEVLLRGRNPQTRDWKSIAGLAATAVYGLLVLLSLSNYYFNPRFGKEQWRDVFAYVENASSPDRKDLLAFDPDYLQLCYRYYQKRDLAIWPVTPAASMDLRNSPEKVDEHARGFRTVWLIRSHYQTDNLLEALRARFPQRSYRFFPKAKGIEVFSFDVPAR